MRLYLEDTKEVDLTSLWTLDSLLTLLEKLENHHYTAPVGPFVPHFFTCKIG